MDMMGTQLNHSTSSDVLRSILATLQSLELRSEDQNTRLGTIELLIASSARPDASSSPMFSYSRHVSHVRDSRTSVPNVAILGSLADHPAAPAYMASVMELSKQFSLERQSSPVPSEDMGGDDEVGEPEATKCADPDNDCYSASVYSSRPLSRLELDIPPIPPPHKSTQREETQSEPVAHNSMPHGSHQFLAMRYEDTVERSTSPSSVPSTPHRSSTGSQDRTWFSPSRHSASTGRTSISIEGTSSATDSKRRVRTTLHGAYSNIKQSVPQASQFIRRSFTATNNSKSKAKVPQTGQTLRANIDYIIPVTNLEENNTAVGKRGHPCFRLAVRTAKACASIFPLMLSLLTREASFIPR